MAAALQQRAGGLSSSSSRPHCRCRPAVRAHQRRALVAPPPRATAVDAAQQVQAAVYAGLGLAAASFVGVFGVANQPFARGALKEELDWKTIYRELSADPPPAIAPEEAAALRAANRAALVDVRLAGRFEAEHAAGSVSAPLYTPIQGWGVAANVRRAAFAFFGIAGTQRNPAFEATARARVPNGADGARVVVLCETGGSLENKSGTKYGFQSRSLKAVHALRAAGFSDVCIVRGGVGAWARAGLPLAEGPEDPADVAAAAAVVAAAAAAGGGSGGSGRAAGGLPQLRLPRLPQLPQLPQLGNVFSSSR